MIDFLDAKLLVHDEMENLLFALYKYCSFEIESLPDFWCLWYFFIAVHSSGVNCFWNDFTTLNKGSWPPFGLARYLDRCWYPVTRKRFWRIWWRYYWSWSLFSLETPDIYDYEDLLPYLEEQYLSVKNETTSFWYTFARLPTQTRRALHELP